MSESEDNILKIFRIIGERPHGCDNAAKWVVGFDGSAANDYTKEGENYSLYYDGYLHKFNLHDLWDLSENGDLDDIIVA